MEIPRILSANNKQLWCLVKIYSEKISDGFPNVLVQRRCTDTNFAGGFENPYSHCTFMNRRSNLYAYIQTAYRADADHVDSQVCKKDSEYRPSSFNSENVQTTAAESW